MGKRKDYRTKVVEMLLTFPGRSYESSGSFYVVSGRWSSAVRGQIRALFCEISVIDEPIGVRVRDLLPTQRSEAAAFCRRRGIGCPNNRTIYTLNRNRFDQVSIDLQMQETPIVRVKGKRLSQDRLTFDQKQPLSVFTWPDDLPFPA